MFSFCNLQVVNSINYVLQIPLFYTPFTLNQL